MKFTEESFTNKTEILKFPDHYVAKAVTVSDAGIIADEDGKKIVPAGTIIGGISGSVLADDTIEVEVKNTQSVADPEDPGTAVDAEGVLFNDVDVTYGSASGAMIIHGFIDSSKLPEEVAAEAVTALAGRIILLG